MQGIKLKENTKQEHRAETKKPTETMEQDTMNLLYCDCVTSLLKSLNEEHQKMKN